MPSTIYVGLFFLEGTYDRGIESTIAYFRSIVDPSNAVVILEYNVTGEPELTINRLQQFLSDVSGYTDISGNVATISENTSNIKVISEYLYSNYPLLEIPCFSINATATLVKNLPNTLTYAPFDQYSVMSNFMIYKEYQMKHLKILYQPNSLDDDFFQSYIDLMYLQGEKLGIIVEDQSLRPTTNYNLQADTAIILLFRDYSLINSNLLNQISNATGCYISMTDINENVGNIFENIPAFVVVPFPINYTSTSQNVYHSLGQDNKTNYVYSIYGFFDILYTINFFTRNPTLRFILTNYVNVNAFITIPPALGYSSWNLDINGSNYGVYDVIFTKDSVIGSESDLLNSHNNGGIARLPDSQSIFMSLGIAPFFSSKIFYCRQNYIKIYNENKELVVVRFEKNTTEYAGKTIIVSETLPCNFSISYDPSYGFFSALEPIFSICNTKLVVNATMSKQITNRIIFEDAPYNQQTVDELKATLCGSSPQFSPQLRVLVRGKYQSNPNSQNNTISRNIYMRVS